MKCPFKKITTTVKNETVDSFMECDKDDCMAYSSEGTYKYGKYSIITEKCKLLEKENINEVLQ